MTDNKKSKKSSKQAGSESSETPRPRLSKSKVAQALKAASGRPTLAAAKLGVTHNAINGWIKRHPELREVREEAQQQLVDVAETRLQIALNAGEQWAIERVLKSKAAAHLGYYYHERTRHEVELSAGGGAKIHIYLPDNGALDPREDEGSE